MFLPDTFNPAGEGFSVSTGYDSGTYDYHGQIFFQLPYEHLTHCFCKYVRVWPSVNLCPDHFLEKLKSRFRVQYMPMFICIIYLKMNYFFYFNLFFYSRMEKLNVPWILLDYFLYIFHVSMIYFCIMHHISI